MDKSAIPVLRIAVNAYEANVAKRVGSNKYAFELLHRFEAMTRKPVSNGTLQIEWEIFLPTPPLVDLPKPRPGFKYVVIGPKVMWTQWRLPLALYVSMQKYDVELNLGHYAPRFCPCPSVVCVLDLAFLKFPQFFLKKDLYQLREWTRYSVRQAQKIVTISESTKKDVLEEYKKTSDQVIIAYPGVEAKDHEAGETADPFGIETDRLLIKHGLTKGNYILSVGTIQPRKNIIHSIKAFEQLNPQNDNRYKLVLIGKPGWMTSELDETIAQSSQKENIVRTGFVEEKEKYLLLRSAAASFLIGYYEGFGIPAIESLSVGVVPVVANTGSLPEVVGNFGILIDPYSVESIANGFAQALTNQPTPIRRAEMREWARQFSWETSAQKILDMLIEAFGRNK